ncbi:hypothetical protein BE21_08300 [Sorangium cellulosum]|uniref:Uncharacterized protein n=1 Tax=Sorangium cellulosum TaxID=56 RepID=A0A150U2N5_SORCE|nr:hypothetical protein BE21_08300 [Sorangium cellulosum]
MAAMDIGALGSIVKSLAKKAAEKLSEKLGLNTLEEAVDKAISTGAREGVEDAAESAGKVEVVESAGKLARGVPKLKGATAPERAREAVKMVADFDGTQAEKAKFWESLVPQMREVQSDFVSSPAVGSEGSIVYLGARAEALVITAGRQVFRGRFGEGVTFGPGGTFTPIFEKLRLIK